MHVREQHDHAPVLGQLRQRLLQHAAHIALQRDALRRRSGIGRFEGDGVRIVAQLIKGALWAPLATAKLVTRGVRHDPKQPGTEALASKAVERSIRAQEGLLRHILGGFARAEETVGEGVSGVLMADDKGVEGGHFAALRSLNERDGLGIDRRWAIGRWCGC